MRIHNPIHLLTAVLFLAGLSALALAEISLQPSPACDPSKQICPPATAPKKCESTYCFIAPEGQAVFEKKNNCKFAGNCDLRSLFWDAITEKESSNAKCTLANNGCRATTGSPVYGGVADAKYIGASGGTAQTLHYEVIKRFRDETIFKKDDACRQGITQEQAKEAYKRADKIALVATGWVNKLYGWQKSKDEDDDIVSWNKITKKLEFDDKKIKDNLVTFTKETGLDEAMFKRMAMWGFLRARIVKNSGIVKTDAQTDAARDYLGMTYGNGPYTGLAQYSYNGKDDVNSRNEAIYGFAAEAIAQSSPGLRDNLIKFYLAENLKCFMKVADDMLKPLSYRTCANGENWVGIAATKWNAGAGTKGITKYGTKVKEIYDQLRKYRQCGDEPALDCPEKKKP